MCACVVCVCVLTRTLKEMIKWMVGLSVSFFFFVLFCIFWASCLMHIFLLWLEKKLKKFFTINCVCCETGDPLKEVILNLVLHRIFWYFKIGQVYWLKEQYLWKLRSVRKTRVIQLEYEKECLILEFLSPLGQHLSSVYTVTYNERHATLRSRAHTSTQTYTKWTFHIQYLSFTCGAPLSWCII